MSTFESRRREPIRRLRGYALGDEGIGPPAGESPHGEGVLGLDARSADYLGTWRHHAHRLPPHSHSRAERLISGNPLFDEFISRAGTIEAPSLRERQVFSTLTEGIHEIIKSFHKQHDTARIFSDCDLEQRELLVKIGSPVLIRSASGERKIYLSTFAELVSRERDSSEVGTVTAVIGGGMCYAVRGRSEMVWEIRIPEDARDLIQFDTLTTQDLQNLSIHLRVLYDEVAFYDGMLELRAKLSTEKPFPFDPVENQGYFAQLLVQRAREQLFFHHTPASTDLGRLIESAEFVSDYVIRARCQCARSQARELYLVFRRNPLDFTVDCVPLHSPNGHPLN